MPPSGGLLSCPGCPRGTSQPKKVWRSTYIWNSFSNMYVGAPWFPLRSCNLLQCWSFLTASSSHHQQLCRNIMIKTYNEMQQKEHFVLLNRVKANLRSLERSSVSVFWVSFATSLGRQATLLNKNPIIIAIGAFMLSLKIIDFGVNVMQTNGVCKVFCMLLSVFCSYEFNGLQ